MNAPRPSARLRAVVVRSVGATRIRLLNLAFAAVAGVVVVACKPGPDPHVTSTPTSASAAPVMPAASTSVSDPDPSNEEAPLKEGHGSFEGMVRPTKGGYSVRGVVLEDDTLPKLLARPPGQTSGAKDSEWFLGAVVRVTADLKPMSVKPPPDGEVMQMRMGDFWVASNVTAAVVVKPAEVIEGTLERSKGFFGIAGKLVSRDDLAWSLSPTGGEAGQHVKLYGQSKTVVCEPNAQCLIEGSLPLFLVGRAERLP